MVGIRTGRGKLALVAALVCSPLAAQKPLSLEEAGARDPSANFLPLHRGEAVIIRGVVNSFAYRFPDYTLLAVDDGSYGAVLRSNSLDSRLNEYRPGDEI